MTTTHAPGRLGSPLAVFADHAVCDTRHEHEVRIITDGTRVYAYGRETEAQPGADRDVTLVSVYCGQPLPHGQGVCEGRVTVDLSTAGAWTTDPDAIRYVETSTVRVNQ